ncbi:hypothetical protein EJV47_19880 [Hymenobacter gummosus]|uniref:Uncharacterized protein n=1 Tax=Hymenobacter gummosus TaxID=1776032 RepID=A0A3S0H2S8_9BACT|nr:hypothetical protein [Hymenobacter gummosus]RTQ47157.1 hypothetical protein EJV47_19880 [Hymenobacter gummosus]
MRSAKLFFLLLLLVSFGCQKDKVRPVATLEVVDEWTALLDVTAAPGGSSPLFMPTSRIWSACADTCRRNKTSLEQLQSAALSEATLTVDAPPGQNFDFLRSMTFYIMSNQGNDQIPLASITAVPRGATRLTLTPTDASLLAYLRNREYYLKPQLELSQPGQTVARVQLQLRYRVQARQL